MELPRMAGLTMVLGALTFMLAAAPMSNTPESSAGDGERAAARGSAGIRSRAMSLLRALLLVNVAAAVGYAIGLVVFPGLLADLGMGPSDPAWQRYLVPLYLGLGAMVWAADRVRPLAVGTAWALVVLSAGLVAAHLVNLALGDETLTASGAGLIAFDLAMALGLLAAISRSREA